MHSDTQASQSRVYTEREPTGRVTIVIVAEREDKREESREGEREKYEGSERKKKGREKERRRGERERGLPCVGSKRLRVYRQNARMCSTCARFAGTTGGVLNPHTETF